jgi:hypothetical protein
MSAQLRLRAAGALAFGIALYASVSSSAYAGDGQVGDIMIMNAWARATTAKVGGAFLMVHNEGAADRLVSVSTPIANKAQIHQTKTENGAMEMRAVDGIDVPAHGMIEFKPGGYHIMLMGLTKPLKMGDSFPVTLTFAKAGAATVTVDVKAAGATGGDSMDHMDMGHTDSGSKN